MATGRTMFEKIWSRHVVAEGPGGRVLLYVDRHLLHEGSTHAFGRLEKKGRRVRRPEACFFENCFKNGVLAVVLPAGPAAGLRRALAERPGAILTVELEPQTLTAPDSASLRFEVDAFRKHGLLTGQDELALTLEHLPAIEAFEARRRGETPWID